MKVPYSGLELSIALISAVNKLDGKEDELKKALELIHKPTSNINHEAAKFNGISITDLINSPNMEYMVETYKESCILKGIETLESFGLTNKEAWAAVVEITDR